MENENLFDSELIVTLKIGEEENEVMIEDLNKTIRDEVATIVNVFNLPKLDGGGNPVIYELYKIEPGNPEGILLRTEDENGDEMAMIDFDIKRGDYLELVQVPIAG